VVAAAAIHLAQGHVPGPVIGVVFVLALLLVARFAGVVYAVPVALASFIAFDWYFLPPTHAFSWPSTANLLALGGFLLTSVLVGGVVADAGRRADVSEEARGALADEQAALRRVATLVARERSAEQVFTTVTEEVGRLFRLDVAQLLFYEGDGTGTVIAGWGTRRAPKWVGASMALEGDNVPGLVFRTQRPARMDDFASAEGSIAERLRADGIRSVVGTPILVEGELWGVMLAGSMQPEPLPVATEARMEAFTQLVATAISNAEARRELEQLAAEQAGLRRVATLVARAAPPAELFAAVTEEVGQLLHVDGTTLSRYEPDGTVAILAGWSRGGADLPVGERSVLGGKNLSTMVFRTGRPARMDSYEDSSGALAPIARDTDLRSAIGAPIVVDGRIWGVMIAGYTSDGAPPRDTEARLRDFTDLVSTAISNAETRSELAASRARVVAAADHERRRLERDLHAGIQQRLVSLALEVRTAETMTPGPAGELRSQLSKIVEGLGAALHDLRDISRGIHPAILSEGGLEPALKALARRSTVPVTLDVNLDSRLAEPVEVAAYYIACEALANAAMHAAASVVELRVNRHDGSLTLSVHDDGIGGADPTRGSGLIGLTDRIEALGGTISLVSPAGGGTSLHVELPVG
jgi:signal transduction histidine kinase